MQPGLPSRCCMVIAASSVRAADGVSMRSVFRLLVLCGLMTLPRVVFGGCPGVWSDTTTSQNERYIFVLRASDPKGMQEYAKREREGWVQAGYTPEAMADANKHLQASLDEEARLRAKYPVSGLYLNDGSSKLLWAGQFCGAQFAVASDGIHLVIYNIVVQKMEDPAVAFYASGRELRSYKVSDLLSPDSPRGETSHGFKWAEDFSLDERAGVFTSTKFDGGMLVFDIKSGEAIRPNPTPERLHSRSANENNTSAHQRAHTATIAAVTAAFALLCVVYWVNINGRSRQ